MKLAMLVTVGTGAHVWEGISYGIGDRRPDYVLFLTTAVSEAQTLPRVIEAVNLAEEDYGCFRVADENDVEKCTLAFIDAIGQVKARGFDVGDLVLDFTSGTKAMSAGLVVAGLDASVGKLSYVAGDRGDDGRVVSGTERSMSLEPNRLALRREMAQAVGLFNALRFDACLEVVEPMPERIRSPQVALCVSLLQTLARAYRAWDRFDFSAAARHLGEASGHDLLAAWQVKGRMARQNGYLHRLVDDDFCAERAVELWLSAEKRAMEDRFDDAMARLYRLLEYVAQMRLFVEHGGIETGDLDVAKLPENVRARYERLRTGQGKVEIGLRKSYRLLADLNDPVGQWFDAVYDAQLKKVLGMRNQSILAHGFAPVGKDSYDRAVGCVRALLDVACPKWKKTVKVAGFPKLDAERVVQSLGLRG